MASDERWFWLMWNSALILVVIVLLNNSNISVHAVEDPSKFSAVILPTNTANLTIDYKSLPKAIISHDRTTVKTVEDQQSILDSNDSRKLTAPTTTTTTTTAPLTVSDAQQKKVTNNSVGTTSSGTTSTIASSPSTTTQSITTILPSVDKSVKPDSNLNSISPEDDDDIDLAKNDDERLGLSIPDPSIPSPDQTDYQDSDGADGDGYLTDESINKASDNNNLNTDKKNENNDINTNKEATFWKTATSYGDPDDGNSHFFIYFLTVVGMCILMYVLFHNKQKILALIVEGRQERRRRPNTSQYRPLDNNLEEVIQGRNSKNGRTTNDSEN